jgi:hypothetical protein
MYFGVTIEERGMAVNEPRTLRVRLWDTQGTGTGTLQCDSGDLVTPVTAGRARIALPAECVAAVQRSPEQWAELSVNSSVVGGRSRLGAVPFAVEAQRANDLTAAATTRLREGAYRSVQNGPATSTGEWVNIPGTEVTFTLATARSVDLVASGQATSVGNTTNAGCGFRFVLDGVPVSDPAPSRNVDVFAQGLIVPWSAIWSWPSLAAAPHTIRLEIAKLTSNATNCSTIGNRLLVTTH